jgi:hypothetical protein
MKLDVRAQRIYRGFFITKKLVIMIYKFIDTIFNDVDMEVFVSPIKDLNIQQNDGSENLVIIEISNDFPESIRHHLFKKDVKDLIDVLVKLHGEM